MSKTETVLCKYGMLLAAQKICRGTLSVSWTDVSLVHVLKSPGNYLEPYQLNLKYRVLHRNDFVYVVEQEQSSFFIWPWVPVGKDLRGSIVQPPAQSSINEETGSGCLRLYAAWSCEHWRMEAAQPLWAMPGWPYVQSETLSFQFRFAVPFPPATLP